MNIISIQTTQNVTIDYELAGIWERLLAFLLDTVIVIVYIILMTFLFSSASNDALKGNDIFLIFAIVFLLPVWLGYHFMSEAFAGGQSLGKKALRIKVVRNDGQQMDMSDYSMRWMFRIIDILLSSGIIAVVSIMSSSKNQRIGDMVGDTSVIKLDPQNKIYVKDIMAIKNKKNYEPTYEEVINFTEDDMLLLKNALERAKLHPNDHYKELLKELTEKICAQLEIKEIPKKRVKFLQTVLNDYIVLTR